MRLRKATVAAVLLAAAALALALVFGGSEESEKAEAAPAVPGLPSVSIVSPRNGARYADRSLRVPGLVHEGGAVVKAFARVGWGWGGDWSWPKDYQHFSASGT